MRAILIDPTCQTVRAIDIDYVPFRFGESANVALAPVLKILGATAAKQVDISDTGRLHAVVVLKDGYSVPNQRFFRFANFIGPIGGRMLFVGLEVREQPQPVCDFVSIDPLFCDAASIERLVTWFPTMRFRRYKESVQEIENIGSVVDSIPVFDGVRPIEVLGLRLKLEQDLLLEDVQGCA